MRFLAARGWKPEHVAISRSADLAARSSAEALVVLAVAKPGSTRLIDNLELEALTSAMADHV